ncbi:MAG: DMT family transporter [Bacteroidetes bacterium]|nr:DMT family transporter [Bacteroidota bacterium]
MNKTYKAHLALIAITLIFGFHYTIAKSLMPDYLHPMQLLFIRVLGGLILFFVYHKLFVREKVEKKDMLLLALCGLTGFALNQAFFYKGLDLTTPVDASLIHVMNPIFVMVFASLIIREKITWVKIAGIIIGGCGAVVLILYGKVVNMSTNSFAGNLYVFLNMVFYAVYLVLVKPLAVKYHPITILMWISIFGFMFILPFSVWTLPAIQFQQITITAWLSIAYIIFFNTFLAYILINLAMKVVNASAVSYYSYLQPLIASVASVSVGNEVITLPKILAALLIFAGVFLVSRKKYA